MDYAKKSTEELKQMETVARAEIQKGEADGASKAVMRARYGVLGAVSAALATRDDAPIECECHLWRPATADANWHLTICGIAPAPTHLRLA